MCSPIHGWDARLLAKARQERLGVDRQQAVLGIDLDAVTEPAVEVNGRRREGLGDVGQPRGHGVGQRLDTLGRDGDRRQPAGQGDEPGKYRFAVHRAGAPCRLSIWDKRVCSAWYVGKIDVEGASAFAPLPENSLAGSRYGERGFPAASLDGQIDVSAHQADVLQTHRRPIRRQPRRAGEAVEATRLDAEKPIRNDQCIEDIGSERLISVMLSGTMP